ncbi:helix-turn-helix domain-containing protein [Bacillus anthracis]|uniref:helix-turn-helix domain-containing protein n=1 Tax=Bacillus anthracis TaxID=1392 RepID=UPI002DBDB1E1|nr:helix-turn-helix domain-containing protein [Bacillus anthracis]MEB9904742.1 helix-turn-helix domain-containing protein [Bacillus anthracis]MEC1957064.1 helix-turn-helix domain-containing protein [Bacillus anthracis]
MREILSKNLLRHLKLLEILYREVGWVTLSNIATLLKCSERVLRNDIQLINKDFKPFEIVTSQHGITLVYPSEYSISYIYQRALSISPEFSFMEHIFFRETDDINSISEKLFISTSSLRRIIKKINTHLIQYDIQIKNNPVSIVGSEENVRNFILHYIYEKYGISQPLFSELQLETINEMIVYMAKDNSISLDSQKIIRLRYLLIISIYRLKNKHVVNLNEKLFNNRNLNILKNIPFSQRFKQVFQLDLNKQSLMQIFHFFLNNKYAYTYDQLEYILKENIDNSSVVIHDIKKLLSNISNKINIPIQNEKKIIMKLYNLQYRVNSPNFILNRNRKYFATHVSHEFIHFIFILKEELQNFKYHKDFKWTPYFFNEILYILITHWENAFFELLNTIQLIKVGLFFDSDFEHSLFIKGILNYQFNKFIETELIDSLSLSSFKSSIKNYDFIITNISGICDSEVPLLCINTIPIMKDFTAIQEKLLIMIKQKFQNHQYILSKNHDVNFS